MKKAKLKELTLKSVDFCKLGVNQEAFITLKKSIEEGKDMNESWEDFAKKAEESMKESLNSIMADETLGSGQKEEKIGKSVTEFINTVRKFSKEVQKSISSEIYSDVKKELEEAKILKSQLFEIQKSLELEQLEFIAKKYEILGKDPKELSVKLYEMKKSNEDTYNEYIALLDESVELTDKSGIFKEAGSGRNGRDLNGQFEQKVDDIMKSDTSLTYEQAFIKICDSSPELKKYIEQGV